MNHARKPDSSLCFAERHHRSRIHVTMVSASTPTRVSLQSSIGKQRQAHAPAGRSDRAGRPLHVLSPYRRDNATLSPFSPRVLRFLMSPQLATWRVVVLVPLPRTVACQRRSRKVHRGEGVVLWWCMRSARRNSRAPPCSSYFLLLTAHQIIARKSGCRIFSRRSTRRSAR
jgi:hypothetical protein